jgi:5,5'-dehydrodivanillate O-demethylase oxygenase subunit
MDGSKVENRAPSSVDFEDFVRVGPGTLAGRYLRRFWHPICLTSDVATGRARAIRLLGEDFTFYRGESGTPHLIDLRCAHRCAQLWTGKVEGETIRCFYHGWRYDESGQCVEQPAEDPRYAQQIRIGSYPVEDYLGLVFAYIGRDPPPPLPRYSVFEKPGLFFTHVTFLGEYNYFQNIENLVDPMHAAFAHSSFFAPTGAALAPVKAERSTWGITISRAGVGQGVSQFGMPNTFQIAGALATPDAMSAVWVVPLDDEKHRFYSVRSSRDAAPCVTDPNLHEIGRRVMAGDVEMESFEGKLSPMHYQLLQDIVVQGSQGVVVDRARERLGRSDAGIALLRRFWAAELSAVASDAPMTQWTWSPELTRMHDWVWRERV